MSKTQTQVNSIIINQKKQLFLDVAQSRNTVPPNGQFNYQVYLKNISGNTITNVRILIINPYEIDISGVPSTGKGFKIGSLKNGQSVLLNIKARASIKGYYFVNFIAFGDSAEIQYKTLKVKCSLDKDIENVTHRINFYNFHPYESHYKLQASDYSEQVSQLTKVQAKPYGEKRDVFELRDNELDLYDQDIFLQNEDDISSMYIGRESFETSAKETYDGFNFQQIIKQINDNSKIVSATFLRTGNNEMETDLYQLYPNGFLHRFGLLKSEIYHRLGVIPRIVSSNDQLFRWSDRVSELPNIYPAQQIDHWDEKVWCGEAYTVWQCYTDKNQQKHYSELQIFTKERTAERYIEKAKEYNNYNNITGYTYEIRTNFYTQGIFFIEIPVKDIPTNFFFVNNDDLYAIIDNTKPLGMKGIIRYLIESDFNHNIEFNHTRRYIPHINLDLPDYDKLKYFIRSLKYKLNDDNSVSLNPNGKFTCNNGMFYLNQLFFAKDPDYNIVDNESNAKPLSTPEITLTKTNAYKNTAKLNLNDVNDLSELLIYDKNNIMFYKQLTSLYESKNQYNDSDELIIQSKAKPHSYYNCAQQTFDYDPKDDFNFVRLKAFTSNQYIENGLFISNGNKKHLISMQYIPSAKQYRIFYKKMSDINIVVEKEAYFNASSIFAEIERKDNQFLVILYVERDNLMYYFDSFLTNEIDNIGVLLRNTNVTEYCSNKISENVSFYHTEPHTISTNTMCKKPYYNCITTDQYDIIENQHNNINWDKLYRINEDDTSYAILQNRTNNNIQPNDITLYFNDLNIKEDSKVKDIIMTSYISTNNELDLETSTAQNINYILENKDNRYGTILEPSGFNHYRDNSLKFLENELSIADLNDNISDVEYYKKQIEINKNYNTNANYTNINGDYWTEVDFVNDLQIDSNDIRSIKLIIQGNNTSNQVTAVSELRTNQSSLKSVKTEINTGYFYKIIELPFSKKYDLNNLAIRFKFNELGHMIDIFDIKTQLNFVKKQNDNYKLSNYEDIHIPNNKFFTVNLLQNLDEAFVNNGLLINLHFNEIKQGQYIKIHSIKFDIIYEENASVFSIKSIPEGSVVSGNTNNCIMNGKIFDETISIEQLDHTERNTDGTYCHGIALEEAIYQSFVAQSNNISSIEINPNGYVGVPNSKIKISILSDYDKMPDKVLKEVIVNGWRKQNLNNETIKYNIYTDNLIIGNKYWFKIEVVSPNNGYYWLKYNKNAIVNYRLLYTKNGNVINGMSTLWFRIYSKNNFKEFQDLPVTSNNLQTFMTMLTIYDGNISNFKIQKVIN